MQETLHALGGLLLKALPTFLLVILLHFYLKRVFFRPLDKVLREREEATEGARKTAEASLAAASKKAAEYEQAIRAARGEIYREQEETRRKWRQEQASTLEEARLETGDMIRQAKSQLATEAAEARQALAAESDRLAGEIVESILKGRAN
jgi:F-type H+-transporting ATPase subunit b